MNFYANVAKFQRHALNRCEVFKEHIPGDPLKEKPITVIEHRRQDVVLKMIKPYTSKKQRDVLKENGMKWGYSIIILENGDHYEY